MAVLPSGFALPSLPYLLALVVGVAVVAGLLYRAVPPVTEDVAVALSPWMVAGAAGYVLYELDAVPEAVAPFFGSPAVYLATFVVAGAVWLAADAADLPADGFASATTPSVLAAAGTLAALGTVGAALLVGTGRPGGLALFWPAVGLVGSAVVAAAAWFGLRRWLPDVAVTGRAGALVLLGHALDGVSTAIGADVLGFGEQTPLSRAVIEFAASLPTAPYLGSGWLFVLVKVALAALVVAVLADSVRERPREGYLLLAAVAAVGLGPGAHNLVLFAVA